MSNDNQREVAEHVRKAYKQLRWAAANIAAIYEIIRPKDMPALSDPNQLKLFDNECQGI